MKTTVFANYGTLFHEKEVVYTVGTPIGEIYDKLTVDIPDKMHPYINQDCGVCVQLDGDIYLLRDVLGNANTHGERGEDAPSIKWVSDNMRRNCEKLVVIQRPE